MITGPDLNSLLQPGDRKSTLSFQSENWDFNWNAVWKGKIGLEDSAWVAEIEMPLSQLRYSNEDEQVWGLHTWRWIDRLQEESNWESQSKTGPGMLYNLGRFKGIKGLKNHSGSKLCHLYLVI